MKTTLNYCFISGSVSIRLTEESIPSYAIRNDPVSLVCNYDMEGDKLYSVKWYSNGQEFYRYIPTDTTHYCLPQPGNSCGCKYKLSLKMDGWEHRLIPTISSPLFIPVWLPHNRNRSPQRPILYSEGWISTPVECSDPHIVDHWFMLTKHLMVQEEKISQCGYLKIKCTATIYTNEESIQG